MREIIGLGINVAIILLVAFTVAWLWLGILDRRKGHE